MYSVRLMICQGCHILLRLILLYSISVMFGLGVVSAFFFKYHFLYCVFPLQINGAYFLSKETLNCVLLSWQGDVAMGDPCLAWVQAKSGTVGKVVTQDTASLRYSVEFG